MKNNYKTCLNDWIVSCTCQTGDISKINLGNYYGMAGQWVKVSAPYLKQLFLSELYKFQSSAALHKFSYLWNWIFQQFLCQNLCGMNACGENSKACYTISKMFHLFKNVHYDDCCWIMKIFEKLDATLGFSFSYQH
jgi:hypothetical protein